MAATIDGPDGPRVLFQVVGLVDNPAPRHPRSGELVLRIEYVNPRSRAAYVLSSHRYRPYREAIARAIRDQETYWVDLSPAESLFAALQDSRSVSDRILDAIRDRQVAPPEELPAPADNAR